MLNCAAEFETYLTHKCKNSVYSGIFVRKYVCNFLKKANISCVYAYEKSNTLKAKNYALSNFSL